MLVDRGPAAECGGPRAIVTVIEIAERFSRWETQSQLNITVSIAWSRRMAIAVDDELARLCCENLPTVWSGKLR